MRQRLRRACANVHSLLTVTHIELGVDHAGMSGITAFMLNGCTTRAISLEKKQTYLANLLGCY